jgi:hypothetical protein
MGRRRHQQQTDREQVGRVRVAAVTWAPVEGPEGQLVARQLMGLLMTETGELADTHDATAD